MAKQVLWERIRLQGGHLVEQAKSVLREGNVRRVVVKQGSRTVAEFPLTVGVVGALGAPVLAAVGALAALVGDCRLEIERRAEPKRAAKPARRRPARRRSRTARGPVNGSGS